MKKYIFVLILISFNYLYSSNKVSSGFGIGPLYGVNIDENIDHILGLDISYTTETVANISIPVSTISLVPRLFLGENLNNYGVDLELTTYLIFNIGGGVGYQNKEDSAILYHIFLGLPLPIMSFTEKHTFKNCYFEPYYRYNYSNNVYSHEFGILIKVSTVIWYSGD